MQENHYMEEQGAEEEGEQYHLEDYQLIDMTTARLTKYPASLVHNTSLRTNLRYDWQQNVIWYAHGQDEVICRMKELME